jgi:hypothetical protein
MKHDVCGQSFYNEYHSHRITDLDVVHSHLRQQNNSDGIIFLAGDSSLDNKFWFNDSAPAVNGYEEFLSPPKSRKDVAYWMNKQLANTKQVSKSTQHNAHIPTLPFLTPSCQLHEQGSIMAVLNCAIEESTIESRSRGKLLPQDVFIRDHITPDDVLVISLGGNDIALRPSPCTICNILSLVCCTTTRCIETCSSCGGSDCCCDCAVDAMGL